MNAPLEPRIVPGLEFFVLARSGNLPEMPFGLAHEPCELRHMALDVHGREVCLGVTATGSHAEIAPLRRLFAVEPIQLHPEEAKDVVEVWV
jgi:hypothetical protein